VDWGAIGDFNLDGKPDVVSAGPNSGQVQIYIDKGDGTFQTPIATAVDHPVQPVIGDLNQDGKLDLVAPVSAFYDGTLAINVFGTADGHFSVPVEYSVGGRGLAVQIADANTDGKPELIAISPGLSGVSTISTLLGNGDGSFQPAINSRMLIGGMQRRPQISMATTFPTSQL
jgi:hypothetical protein